MSLSRKCRRRSLSRSAMRIEYRERALAMIDKKLEGQEVKAFSPAPRCTGQVVDIFAALKKSLETASQQKSQTAARGKRKRKA